MSFEFNYLPPEYNTNAEGCSNVNYLKPDEADRFDASLFNQYNSNQEPVSIVSFGEDVATDLIDEAKVEEAKKQEELEKQAKEEQKKKQEAEKNKTVHLNGQIDEFKQGLQGNCWMLATLDSLNHTEKGKKIISDNITINDDSAIVRFPGIDYEVEISNQQIEDARNSGEYSSGDDDVILMELAVQDTFEKMRNGEIYAPPEVLAKINDSNNVLTRGFMQDMSYLYTGQLANLEINTICRDWVDEPLFDGRTGYDIDYPLDLKANDSENYILQACSYSPYSDGYHAYSIRSVDGDNITLFDTVSGEEFIFNRWEIHDSLLEIEYTQI